MLDDVNKIYEENARSMVAAYSKHKTYCDRIPHLHGLNSHEDVFILSPGMTTKNAETV